jgi:penicillin-binding protein 2A
LTLGKKIFRSILIAVLITGIAVILIGCSMVLPTLDASKLNIDYKTTQILDKNDNVILEYQAVPGEAAALKDIPVDLQHALVAVEDSRFYDHNGIDFRSIGRAIYRDILTGSKVEGGSTITQQLAKNVYLTHEKTYTRKIKEIALSAQIERNYSKDDILEMYFNRVYFGNGATGVRMAAETYFAKGNQLNKLSLAESALLAGLPNAPSAYNPWIKENYDKAMQRRNIVLQAMEKQGYITHEQSEKTQAEPIKLQSGKDIKGLDNTTKYPYYLDYVMEEAENKLDIKAEEILHGGVKVYTYLDPKAQESLEDQYGAANNFPANAADGSIVQGASVVVDPKTGGVAALIGGRDQGDHVLRGFNRASMAKVRPGSSFKPVVVYGPAIDLGKVNSNSSLPNRLREFPGGYKPQNWNKSYSDTVPINRAIYQSLNIPAVELLNQIGVDTGYKYATENFGIPLDPEDKGKLGIALGDVEISPLDLAGAYTAFDNEGVRTTPHAIRQIVNNQGNVIGSLDTESNKAIKPETAKVMTKLMQQVIENPAGTGGAARLSGRDVAGKTGTTEMEGTSGNRDAWFAGYTKEYVMVTWMGFDKSDTQHYLARGSELPAAMFSKVMSKALQGTPGSRFDTAVKENPVQQDQEKSKDDTQDNAIIKDLSASLNGNKAQISWSPVGVEGAKYFLYRAELQADGSAVSTAIGDFSKPGYTDTNLQAGKTYMYWVVVWKDKELSKSNIPKLTVPGKVPTTPDAPKPPTTTDPGQTQQPGTGGTQPGTGTGGTGDGGTQPGTGTGGAGNGGTTQPGTGTGGTGGGTTQPGTGTGGQGNGGTQPGTGGNGTPNLPPVTTQ